MSFNYWSSYLVWGCVVSMMERALVDLFPFVFKAAHFQFYLFLVCILKVTAKQSLGF